ncbi:MAG TPA: hypothetical protein VNE63_20910 [Candidatus Acidoferrales bacterium]|nr:hypothetical protein [Candidatus Acidoferrales bacterium]
MARARAARQVIESLKAGQGPAPALADAEVHESTYGQLRAPQNRMVRIGIVASI